MEKHTYKKGDSVLIIGNGLPPDYIHHNFGAGEVCTVVHDQGIFLLLAGANGVRQYVSPEHVAPYKA